MKKTATKQARTPSKKPDRESQLLEAYLEVALREGVENVTLQKIAAHAEVAYSTVHYYFGNTSPLDRALNYVAEASERFMTERVPPALADLTRNALSAYIDAKFEWVRRFPTYASMLCYHYYQATRDAQVRKRSDALSIHTQEHVYALLLREVDKGHYRPLTNAAELAAKIATILRGSMITAMSTNAQEATHKKMIEDLVAATIASHTKA